MVVVAVVAEVVGAAEAAAEVGVRPKLVVVEQKVEAVVEVASAQALAPAARESTSSKADGVAEGWCVASRMEGTLEACWACHKGPCRMEAGSRQRRSCTASSRCWAQEASSCDDRDRRDDRVLHARRVGRARRAHHGRRNSHWDQHRAWEEKTDWVLLAQKGSGCTRMDQGRQRAPAGSRPGVGAGDSGRGCSVDQTSC